MSVITAINTEVRMLGKCAREYPSFVGAISAVLSVALVLMYYIIFTDAPEVWALWIYDNIPPYGVAIIIGFLAFMEALKFRYRNNERAFIKYVHPSNGLMIAGGWLAWAFFYLWIAPDPHIGLDIKSGVARLINVVVPLIHISNKFGLLILLGREVKSRVRRWMVGRGSR
jgi:hypothetical protein